MSRYEFYASAYDQLAGEPIYRAGRERAIAALDLTEGSRVLDVGCGTGLNFPALLAAVGASGRVVGLDRSSKMLAAARHKRAGLPPGTLTLVEADAETIDSSTLGVASPAAPFDAVLCTYSLSLIDNWEAAWRRAAALVRPGGRAGVVDLGSPQGWARLLDPAARLACWLGGSDITAHPWTLLEHTAQDVESWSLRGGHVQVRVGTLPPAAPGQT